MAYGWQANRDMLEIYYAAAVRSMSMSWHDFIFGGFDPVGTVSLDKLPGAFWLQALAVRAFGVHPWVLVAPVRRCCRSAGSPARSPSRR